MRSRPMSTHQNKPVLDWTLTKTLLHNLHHPGQHTRAPASLPFTLYSSLDCSNSVMASISRLVLVRAESMACVYAVMSQSEKPSGMRSSTQAKRVDREMLGWVLMHGRGWSMVTRI